MSNHTIDPDVTILGIDTPTLEGADGDMQVLGSMVRSLIDSLIPDHIRDYDLLGYNIEDGDGEQMRALKFEVHVHDPSMIGLLLGSGRRNVKLLLQYLRTQQIVSHDRYTVITTVDPDGMRQDHINKAVSKIRRDFARKGEDVPDDIYLKSSMNYRIDENGNRVHYNHRGEMIEFAS